MVYTLVPHLSPSVIDNVSACAGSTALTHISFISRLAEATAIRHFFFNDVISVRVGIYMWGLWDLWKLKTTFEISWFQTFARFWMLYSLFWVIPGRLNFMCRRFGTLCSIFIGGASRMNSSCLHRLWKWNRVFRNVYKIETPGKNSSCLHRLWKWNRVFRNVCKIQTPGKNSSCLHRLWKWNRVFRNVYKIQTPGRILPAYIAYENETDYSETSIKLRCRGRILPAYIAYEDGTECSETSIKLRRRGITQK